MTDESIPCPFCGSDDIETFYNRSGVDHLTCQYCGATAKDWNTRVEPDTLPSWAIDAINENMPRETMEYYASGYRDALIWVLSLLKPEEKE
jgi:transcription elongation factor Elf1